MFIIKVVSLVTVQAQKPHVDFDIITFGYVVVNLLKKLLVVIWFSHQVKFMDY